MVVVVVAVVCLCVEVGGGKGKGAGKPLNVTSANFFMPCAMLAGGAGARGAGDQGVLVSAY